MKRTLIIGLFAMAIGAIGLIISGQVGVNAQNTIFGVGTGVIAAIVRIGTPLQRFGGFLIGLVLGTVFVAMQLGLLPGGSNTIGIAISLVVVLVIVGLIHALSGRRVQAWSMLLGVLAMSAGVYPALAANPFAASSLFATAVLTQIAMGMIGFVVVLPVQWFPDETAITAPPVPGSAERSQTEGSSEAESDMPTVGATNSSLDEIIGGSK